MTLLKESVRICAHEGCDNVSKKLKPSKLGIMRYRKYCNKHYEQYYEKKYRLFKENQCCKCGFVAEHLCQLDVDHIDGNKANNAKSNLQTLCANCHRLKTHVNKEYKKTPHEAGLKSETTLRNWVLGEAAASVPVRDAEHNSEDSQIDS